jgi:hypothetical protein
MHCQRRRYDGGHRRVANSSALANIVAAAVIAGLGLAFALQINRQARMELWHTAVSSGFPAE